MVNHPDEATAWIKTFEEIRKELVIIYNALLDDLQNAKKLIEEITLSYTKYLKLNGLTLSLENFSDINQFIKLRNNEERIHEWGILTKRWFRWIEILNGELHPLIILLRNFGFNVTNFRGDLLKATTPFLYASHYYPVNDQTGLIKLDFDEIKSKLKELEERMIIFFPRETDAWKQMMAQSKTSELLIPKK